MVAVPTGGADRSGRGTSSVDATLYSAMALVLDAVLIAGLARELESRLHGARLRAVRLDRRRRSLALLFRAGTLRFGLNPGTASVVWSEAIEPESEDRPLPARVRGVRALRDDRVLILSFARVRGSRPLADVIVEWIANRWTAVVTEGPDKVVRHVLVERTGERALRTGHVWIPPAPSRRAGVDGELTIERWRELLLRVQPEERRQALLAGVAWTSPLNADALLGAAVRVSGPMADDALDAGHRRWEQIARVALGSSGGQPSLWRAGSGLQPYPLPLAGAEAEPVPSLLDACTRVAAPEPPLAPEVPHALLDALRERAVRAWARVDALRRQLAEAPEPHQLRTFGDLLLARLTDFERGADRARILDFDGIPMEVELDPKRSPQDNAAAYYERAARAGRARTRLPGLIAAAEREAQRLDALVERARDGRAHRREILAEVPEREAAVGPMAPARPYSVYRSSGGLEIRVGRGARHNDDLTFHHSGPSDIWMHARHAAGAHVVLRWRGDGNPPARDLAEAACLAALHSKARTSGSVPVDWTRRKYVRKGRKAPPGQVLVERAKTLFVTPDPQLEERLRR